jgi:hypothetical protein
VPPGEKVTLVVQLPKPPAENCETAEAEPAATVNWYSKDSPPRGFPFRPNDTNSWYVPLTVPPFESRKLKGVGGTDATFAGPSVPS